MATEEVNESSDICAICDDGGRILCCDGKCMRSFHPTKEDGEMSKCATLGLSKEQMLLMEKGKFLCKNCEYKQHQCFACGALGSSDVLSGAEVFQCHDISCGHFYHAQCLAGIYYPNKKVHAIVFQQQIAGGKKFFCPMHKCSICGRREKKNIEGMQFAVCRRCPTSFHRKCLPRNIAFQNSEGIIQRAWKGLLPGGRILIYCMRHETQNDLGTPSRDHVIFPGVLEKNKKSDAHENEVEHLADEFTNNRHIFSTKFYVEEDKGPGLKRMIRSVYPINMFPPRKKPKVASKAQDGTVNSNIPNRKKGIVGFLDGREMLPKKDEDTPHQHDNMESSEVSSGNRKQRGKIMKSGCLFSAGKNTSECNADLSTRDDINDIDELRPLSECNTSLEMATDTDPHIGFNGMECFASRDMFPHPQPGSCGWIDGD